MRIRLNIVGWTSDVPVMATTDSDKIAYCRCMDDVRRRLGILASLTGGRVSVGDESADAEIACLQVRKILEQIAFASLAASRKLYATARPKFMYEWRATQILDQLATLHADFYPKAVVPSKVGANRWHFDFRADGFLTKEDFVFLYDTSTDVLHAWNPFGKRPAVIDFKRPLAEWAARIESLLSFHLIRLLDQPDVLLVQLKGDDGKANVLTASPQAG